MSKSYHLKSLENGYGFIRLPLSGGFQQANNLRCWRTSWRRKAFHRACERGPGSSSHHFSHHSLKSPLCSCVSITLPVPSQMLISVICS